MIREYSVQADGDRKLRKDFLGREFSSRCGADKFLLSDGLLDLVQAIRSRFDRATTICSGYRTPEHNANIGGTH